MAKPPIDIDKVVREVLARLAVAPEPSAAAAPKSDAAGPSAVSGESDGVLAVRAPVVTMAELEGKLAGIKSLVVPARSVVTPSVRDELHRRKIALVFDQGVREASSGAVRLVMTVLGSRFDAGPLAQAIQSEGIEIERRRADCLIAATDQLAGDVGRPNTLGLILSEQPAVALCLANRRRGVRAIWGVDAATVDADAAAVGAHLMVVNPEAASVFQLARMVSRFCRGGPHECPEILRERLG
jgi:hypothetical protein